ncbi:serine/threonine protein phosphatase 2A 55 kDa regulatory subunit B beta isoform-like [Ananas comosus]|uniref:Serine/threonine-protein phosphatase 2A 55 kDa regulatory subunit B n=1 Tax=Ananas comosus TaxID=4615 RepID=A0A6P5EWX8_ANACO|nr:serine/threonine protein phosphatase 2A 55 kDa regulatory subunit B beta isoform-like [Ananas comosus]
MNSDTLYSSGNCSVASSSTASPPVYLPNGGRLERQYNYISNDLSFPPEGFPSLRFTTVASQQKSLIAQCRRVYANSHDYNIHSISNNSDGETFISADDLRINLWNLEMCNQGFNIVDAKPANMEHLSEVITCAEFHPTHCNILAYSSSNGSIRLIDMRQSALCDKHSQLFVGQKSPALWSPFTGIISSISDIKFEKNGRHILSRDYMTVKLWDINMDSGPVATFSVHEYLRPMLPHLYASEWIFDKFNCCISGDGLRIATGSYCNQFRVFSCAGENCEETTLEASTNPMRSRVGNPPGPLRWLSDSTHVVQPGLESPGADTSENSYENSYEDSHDFSNKLLHLAWHPTDNIIACAAASSLYMFSA